MKTQSATHPQAHRVNFKSAMRVGAIVAVLAMIGIPLFSSSSASTGSLGKTASPSVFSNRLFAPLPVYSLKSFSPVAETIGTYAADCTTPQTDFVLGDTVCAKTSGVTATDHFVNWLTPDTQVFASGPTITADGQTTSITLPTSASYVGAWKATIASPTDSSITPAVFNVTEAPIIATYLHDGVSCTSIPKTDFVLGDKVCVKINGVPVNATFPNKISWVDTVGFIEQRTDLTTDPQTDQFQLPATDTSMVNGETVDNRGIWRVHVTRNNGRILYTSLFNVSDAQNPAAHLVVKKFIGGGESSVDVGSNVKFIITLTNEGPDAASQVQLSDPTPPNLSLVGLTQTSGTPVLLGCTPPNCSSFPAGGYAEFLAEFTVISGASGTIVSNTALVTSPTSDPDDTTRSATSDITIANGGTQTTCALQCPDNMTVTANTTQGGDSGAVVTFSSAEPSGDCGSVTATPASGSFFAVGTHVVSVSSSTGGGSCSFLVTVVADNPPTITCPLPNITKDAGAGNTETNVTVTAPAATGTNVSVSGIRSDAQLIGEPPAYSPEITDPYPVGTTIINWTATEFIDGQPGRTASCTQKIIVTAPDAPTISCPSDKTFEQQGCGAVTLNAGQIGTPATTGNGITVEATRSDSLNLTSDPYPIGVTTITWTATDNIGRTTSCTQKITIVAVGDTQNPTITAPPNVSVDTSSCGMIVGETELGTPEASDNCGSVNVKRTGVPPGNFFPTGTTTITYTATDGAGNTATATQTVTVTENPAIPPTITAPGDLSFNTGPGATSCGVVVGDATLGSASASDNCAGVTVTRSGVPAGNNFPVGSTVITYTATDRSGNTAQATQTITVVDNTVPIITPPANVTAYTGPGATSCDTVVSNATIGTATATDNCSGVGAVTRTGVPAGNIFPLGTTTINYSVTDAHGNVGTATQTVTVIDNTVPVLTIPANVTVNTGAGATTCSTVVSNATLGVASATDNCPGIQAIIRTGVPAGNIFPVGVNTVSYSVTDGHGNTSTGNQTVTVIDNTQPIISCPASITIESTCPSGAIATYATPTATDNCGVQSVTRNPGSLASGSVFPIGTSTVTHTATDIYGNTSSCSFTVTVLTPQAVVQNLINSVNASSLNGTQKNGLLAKLNAALTAINGGGGNACAKLSDFVNNVQTLISHGDITAAVGNAWISSANHVRNTIGCTSLPCS